MKITLLFLVFIFLNKCNLINPRQDNKSDIRINQVGFLTKSKKQAIIVNPQSDSFNIQDNFGNIVYKGKLLDIKYWNKSDEDVAIADFSSFKENGNYQLLHDNILSHPFLISDSNYFDLIKSSVKAYYFNRASYSLEKPYSGIYTRAYSHPDTSVYIHASAASESRPQGTRVSTPYGWYDAGDYNKYVVNSGITLYTLMLAYEHNMILFDSLSLNIPESSNDIPDLLDEILCRSRCAVCHSGK